MNRGRAKVFRPFIADAWPGDMVEELLKLHAAGYSHAQIAAAINGSGRWPSLPKTRNATLGKLHRMGHSSGGKRSSPAKPLPPKEIVDRPKVPPMVWTQPLDKHIQDRYAGGLTLKVIAVDTTIAFSLPIPLTFQMIRSRLTELGGYQPKRSTDGPKKPKIHNNSFRQHGAPVAGHLPRIVEPNPKHSVHSHDTDIRAQCQWPTSEGARDMHVCGQSVVQGAYCARHAALAYRQAPAPRRAALFHKKHEFDY
jgi:GcrA cell cycle regulator